MNSTNPLQALRRWRRGMAVPMVLLLVCVGMVIVLALYNYSRESYRRAARGTYGTMSEILAESAAEEAWYIVQRDLNDPRGATNLYQLFRGGNDFSMDLGLPILSSNAGGFKDPHLKGYLEQRYADTSFKASLKVEFKSPYKSGLVPGLGTDGIIDPVAKYERVGQITITGQAAPDRTAEGLANFRKFVMTRAFRVVKVTPPVPFDRSGLIILYPEYMTNTYVAGLQDDLNTQFQTAAVGAKASLEQDLLRPINDKVREIQDASKKFYDLYKQAHNGVLCNTSECQIPPPPQWMQRLITQLGGVLSKMNQLELSVQPNKRPFLNDDAVMIARATVKDGKLGSLDDFNYEKNIRDKLKPIYDVVERLQKAIDIINDALDILATVHQLVPCGAILDGLYVAGEAASPGAGTAVRDVCRGLHRNLLDPVIAVLNGLGQVLCLLQKIIIEIPTMGQQAFAGFMGQAEGWVANGVQGAIPADLNTNLDKLTALPSENAYSTFGFGMNLPNYSMGGEFDGVNRNSNMGQIAGDLVKGFIEEILNLIKDKIKTFIMAKITTLAATVTTSAIATNSTCATCVVIIGCAACIAAKAAAYVAITAITNFLEQQMNRYLAQVGGLGNRGIATIVGSLIDALPFIKENEVLRELQLGVLVTNIITAAAQKQDVSNAVESWFQSMIQKFSTKLQAAASSEVDKYGGVLKGYVLRHRFRNLVELTPQHTQGAGGGAFKQSTVGASALDNWRSAFDRVYKDRLWKAKATWIIESQDQWDGLVSRYYDGKWEQGKDPAGGAGNEGYWQADTSYKPNEGYGLNGVVYYSGTTDLKIDFPAGKKFKGRLIVYAVNANILVQSCLLNKVESDSLTVISGKDITLPSGDVQISVHAVNDASKVHLKQDTKLFGNLVIKVYTKDDQTAGGGLNSLRGQLTYNDRLNGTGGGAMEGMKEGHLFVVMSPYLLHKEVKLTE